MFSNLVKSMGESNPFAASVILLSGVYTLGVAPQFTNDPFLKMMAVFLIAPVVIGSMGSTGFPINTDALLLSGIITAGIMKLIQMWKSADKALKRPRDNLIAGISVYSFIFSFYMLSMYLITSQLKLVPFYNESGQKSGLFYVFAMIYIIIMLSNVTGFQVNFSGRRSAPKSEE